MTTVGVVGAGTAGLLLALLLQQRGVEATLYAERTADELIGAMSQDPALTNDFTDNFTDPPRQWANLSSPEATAAYIESFA